MRGILDRLDGALHGLARQAGITTRTCHTAGIRGYELAGQGPLPPLVLLHGLAVGSATQFVPLMLQARRLFRRVIAVDLPGHGASPPLPRMDTPALYTAVVGALDELVTQRPVVYGNSLGGAVALHYALARPTRGLFLASPAGTPLPEPVLRELLDGLLGIGPGGLLPADLGRRTWSRFVAADVRERFDRPHIRALIASVRNEHGFAPEALRQLDTPTLLVWGAEDRMLPAEMLDYWRAWLPATFERPPGIGHAPHVEAPLWTWRRLSGFARDVSGLPTDRDERWLARSPRSSPA